MSNKSNKNRKEPWEQPIYDDNISNDEDSINPSRSKQRRQKQGSSKFLTFLVVLMILIPVSAVATYIITRNNQPTEITEEPKTVEKNLPKKKTEPKKTTKSSSTTSSSESTEQTSEQTEEQQAEAQPEEQPEQQQQQPEAQPEESGSSYTVQAGDNKYRIAANHGIDFQEFLQINGFSSDTMIQPGQVVRLK